MELSRALKRIADPLTRLAKSLRQAMDEKSATLEPFTRARLEAAARGLDRRAKLVLPAWMRMLETLETGEISDDFTDWFEIGRDDGRDSDIGFERHWIDPTVPLAVGDIGARPWRADHIRHLARCRRRRPGLAERRSPHRRAASGAAAAPRLVRLAVPL